MVFSNHSHKAGKEPSYSFASDIMPRRGLLIIISSPSGAGKTSITRLLREDETMKLALSVSFTTRERRPSEVDGVHYHFISLKQFHKLRDTGAFAEWAEVHGNFYGTLKSSIEDMLENGQDMLFDIDYQGAEQLQIKMSQDIVSIFIFPPSMKELRSRLQRRAEDSPETVKIRLENARTEMQYWKHYDYILINEDLDVSLATVKAIIIAERSKHCRYPAMGEFVQSLMQQEL